MSRYSRMWHRKSIVPGRTVVSTISTAEKDSVASRLLQRIATNFNGVRVSRCFPDQWQDQDGVMVKSGEVRFGDRIFPLTVKIGQADGLVVRTVEGNRFSLKPKNGSMTLEIGKRVTCGDKQLDTYAAMIVGTWVVHGVDFVNRVGETMRRSYGMESKSDLPDQFSFETLDGKNQPVITLRELIDVGCYRSAHVGEWAGGRQSTLISVVAGMSAFLHEFKAEGGDEICTFKGLNIGTDSSLWGPYCGWKETVRESGQFGTWNELAIKSASPFAFHLHATRKLFPRTRLYSSFFMEKIGESRLREVLGLMASKEPERFYRLIDVRGHTWRFERADFDQLHYDGYVFPRAQIVDNVMETFSQLCAVEKDSSHKIICSGPRVVMDPHAYIVIASLALGKSVTCQLSGRFMHQYLMGKGPDSRMHLVRNNRLFNLLQDLFGAKQMRFVIYPPLKWDSGLFSQYDSKICAFNKSDWLDKVVAGV